MARSYDLLTQEVCMSVADELEKLAALKERGLLTEQEFAEQKSKLLARDVQRLPAKREQAAPHTPPPKPESGMPWSIKVGIGMFGVVLVILALGHREPSPAEKEMSSARASIKLCWSDHDRKSLDPATKRFVAGTCEMMEQDFRTKHRRDP